MTTNPGQPRAVLEPPTGAPESLSGHITENIENIAAFQLREQQKVTKLIHLMEELRHDLPMVEDRHDSEAVALQQHTDTAKVLWALETVVSGAERKAAPEPKP